MATLAPELGDVKEDEMGARFSRLENLVGNLVRAVGEQPRPQNAPVSEVSVVSWFTRPVRAGVGRLLQCVFFLYPCCTWGLRLG